ncbi:hypothetical protein GCM10023314_05590 [Algibacter agarivorans]|uniref:Secretion system C-terminal sorting domain-containing protein n=2 Tax=Algibacter agarivorans TaxID=1109741 RepID=A0ABP9GBW8_9FLAO
MVLSVATAQIYIGNGATLHYSGGNFASGIINNNNGGAFSVSADYVHSATNYVGGPVSFLGAAGPFNVSLGSDAVNRAPNFTSTDVATVSYDVAGVATGTVPLGYNLADAELYTFTGSISAVSATPLSTTTYGGAAGATVVQVYADANGKAWSKTLTVGTSKVMTFASISAETDILTFSFTEQTGAATIDAVAHTVVVEVANGTDLSALVSSFTLSAGATAVVGSTAQTSGTTSNDFSNDVTYKVTAADGTTTQDWVVTVTEAASAETDILTFSFTEQTGAATIDAVSHTVVVEVANGTDLSALVSSFTLSAGATAVVGVAAQVSGTTSNDFSNDVTYTVTAADGTTTQDWVVTVTEEATLDIDKINLNTFALYPNPVKASSRNVNYNLPNGVSQLNITVYDVLGKVVSHYLNAPNNSGANEVAKPQVAKGIYLLRFSFNNGEQHITKRVVIE